MTERPYVVSFTGCFHGRSLGALGVTTSKSKYRKFLQPSHLSYQIPYADVKGCPAGVDPEVYCVEQLEKDFTRLFKHQVTPEEVACVILEPVLGEGGYIIPPKAWVKKIREICDQHGILLIFDEVQTGFGRTGEWFAAQYFGVTPDIMAIAKGIASGLPLSATVASKELMKKWPLGMHGTTFGGNPIACSVALTTLEILHEENLVENSKVVGAYAAEQLKKLQAKYPIISDVRSVGLMIGIEISNPETGKVDGQAVMKILDYALEEGVLFYLCGNEGEVIRMIPPLTITKEQIDDGLGMLEKALNRYMEEKIIMKNKLFMFMLVLVIALLAACGTKSDNEKSSGSEGTTTEDKKVLIMGTSADYPPFEFVDTAKGEEIIGFDIDLANLIA